MSRKSKRKLLFGLKVLAICGAAVFTVKGIDNLFAEARSNTDRNEDAERIIDACGAVTTDIVVEMEPEEQEGVQEQDVLEDSQGITGSMDLTSEDAYLLAKIAMAEAEGEDVEGKALVILVVLNRVLSNRFPDSITEVIFQEEQFSSVSNGRFDRTEPNRESYDALDLVYQKQWNESQGALYFESGRNSSWHRSNLHFLFQHGNHYFYTEKELDE